MEVNKYSVTQVLQKTAGVFADMVAMKKFENARQILPSDTTYAIVCEVVEREVGEEFNELDIRTTLGVPTSFNSSPIGGLRGRYVAYLALNATRFRIITRDGQIKADEPFANIHVSVSTKFGIGGTNILTTPTHKYVLGQLAIIDANPDFQSEITPGVGIDPLYGLMSAGGADVVLPTQEERALSYTHGLRVFFLLAGGMLLVTIIVAIVSFYS